MTMMKEKTDSKRKQQSIQTLQTPAQMRPNQCVNCTVNQHLFFK